VWEYLLPDALGSVRQIVDANGNVTLAKSYEPYGTVLTSTSDNSGLRKQPMAARFTQSGVVFWVHHSEWRMERMQARRSLLSPFAVVCWSD